LSAKVIDPAAARRRTMPQILARSGRARPPGRAPETYKICPCGLAMTCRFIPMLAVLARIERPVGGHPVDGDQRLVGGATPTST